MHLQRKLKRPILLLFDNYFRMTIVSVLEIAMELVTPRELIQSDMYIEGTKMSQATIMFCFHDTLCRYALTTVKSRSCWKIIKDLLKIQSISYKNCFNIIQYFSVTSAFKEVSSREIGWQMIRYYFFRKSSTSFRFENIILFCNRQDFMSTLNQSILSNANTL